MVDDNDEPAKDVRGRKPDAEKEETDKSQAGLTSTFPVRIDGWVTRLNSVAGVKEGKLGRVTAARYSF